MSDYGQYTGPGSTSQSFDSVFDGLTTCDTNTTNNSNSNLGDSMDTTTPSWLRHEFDEAEVDIFAI